eukprot:4811333-Pyramimonas_sp.AAC.2
MQESNHTSTVSLPTRSQQQWTIETEIDIRNPLLRGVVSRPNSAVLPPSHNGLRPLRPIPHLKSRRSRRPSPAGVAGGRSR